MPVLDARSVSWLGSYSHLPMTMPTSETSSSSGLPNAGDEARAVLWKGILGLAKRLGKRAPPSSNDNPSVVKLKDGAGYSSIYFIGLGLSDFNLAQLIFSERPIFGVEVPWPSAWREAA